MIIQWIVILLLVLIIFNLGSALFFMLTRKGNGKGVAKALTARILLSIIAFIVLMVGYALGLIEPHGIIPPT